MNDHDENPFFEYRLPHVWQSRKINFNKEICKKLQNIEKQQMKTNLLQLTNWSEATVSNSSISSISSNENHIKTTNDTKRMYSNNLANWDQRVHPYFIRLENPRGLYRHPINHWSSSKDIRDYYGLQQQRSYLAYPYMYPRETRRNHLFHYPNRYYSSQTFYPATYFSVGAPFGTKRILPFKIIKSAYRPRDDYYHCRTKLLPTNSYNNNQKSNGNMIVFVLVFTVITIGIVMGLILAITIN